MMKITQIAAALKKDPQLIVYTNGKAVFSGQDSMSQELSRLAAMLREVEV